MGSQLHQSRREFLGAAAAGLIAVDMAGSRSVEAGGGKSIGMPAFGPLKQVKAGVLDVGYFELGPASGTPILLLHGFPYSVDSYIEVAPTLARRGNRVVVPYLRGHGPTRFLDGSTPRSGQQGAIGADVIDLMDALKIDRAILAGYDWGGRAACVAAALWPERCAGLVSVNGYLIQDIAKSAVPAAPHVESGIWYQFYFLTDRGRQGLTRSRTEIAKTIWTRNSPNWRFDDDTLRRHAAAFENSDYVDVVIHSYRHRLGHSEGYPAYAEVERRLAALPSISVPAITLDGEADGVVPATDGTSSASRFSGVRQHRIVADAGHNLPEEAAQDFVDAVWELAAAVR